MKQQMFEVPPVCDPYVWDCVTLQKQHKHSLLMTSPLQTNVGGLSALSCSTAGLPAPPHACWQVSCQTICWALLLVFYLHKLDLTGESSASVRADHQHTQRKQVDSRKKHNCGYRRCHQPVMFSFLFPSTCLFSWLSTTPVKDAWTFPVNPRLTCDVGIWILKKKKSNQRPYFSSFAVNHTTFHHV